MKFFLKIISYFLLAICSFSSYAQIETEELDMLVIDKMSRSQIIEVIKKVRNQAYNNYVNDYELYNIKHWSVLNDSNVIIDTDERFKVAIDFKRKKIKKSVVKYNANYNRTDSLFFNRYSFNDSPHYWLTEFIIRKFINVPHFDFFNYFDDYTFNRQVLGTDTRISFYSENGYEGFFIFNEKYQLKEINFSLVSPYPVDHSQSRNGKRMFDKNWLYTVENVEIKLQVNSRKELIIKSLDVEEQMVDYNFIRYNQKREVLFEDRQLRFHSKLHFEKI